MNHYDFFSTEEEEQRPPQHLANFANREAKRIFRLIESWHTKLARIGRIVNRPGVQELVEATDVRKFVGYFLSVMFFIGLFVEWSFSNDVYQSSSEIAFLFFLGLVVAGLYASACFNTIMKEFRSRITTSVQFKEYYEVTYENQVTPNRHWYVLHPLNGVVVFLLVELIVYHLSSQRVAWQQDVSSDAGNDVWLPCIWFFLEIIFGMGCHYSAERLFVTGNFHRYEQQLSLGELEIEKRTHKCLDAWHEYNDRLDELTNGNGESRLPLPARILPNEYLQALLDRENGGNGQHGVPTALPLTF